MQEHEDGLPSAEDLDAIAEEQSIADATANIVNNSFCVTCQQPASRICTHCGQEFCSKHFCITHEFGVESKPLVDDEGATHKGRHIRLIGEGWPNHLLLIKDLSDIELDKRIADLQGKLTEAIRTADYTQISLAAHEFERDYRAHSRHVAAIKRREKLEKQGQIRLNAKKHSAVGKTIPADIAALMKLANITYEQAVALKAQLGKAKS